MGSNPTPQHFYYPLEQMFRIVPAGSSNSIHYNNEAVEKIAKEQSIEKDPCSSHDFGNIPRGNTVNGIRIPGD